MGSFGVQNWVAFLPILLSVVSFAKFVRDVRREHDPSYKPFKRNSNILVALGFVGLGGSVLVATYGVRADRGRQEREEALESRLVALSSDNASLKESQQKLLHSNGDLASLVVNLQGKIQWLESAANEAAETSQRIEGATASIQESAEQNAEASRRQAEAADKLASVEQKRAEHEDQCIQARKFNNTFELEFYGCESQSADRSGGIVQSVEQPHMVYPGPQGLPSLQTSSSRSGAFFCTGSICIPAN